MSFYLFAEFGLDCLSGRTGDYRGTVDPPSSFGVFTVHKMAAAGTPVFDLAAGGNLDSFA